MNEYEEISKIKEEKDERIQIMKSKNDGLEADRSQCLADIEKLGDDIDETEKRITATSEAVLDKDKEKK